MLVQRGRVGRGKLCRSLVARIRFAGQWGDVHVSALLNFDTEDRSGALLLALSLLLNLRLALSLHLMLLLGLPLALLLALLRPGEQGDARRSRAEAGDSGEQTAEPLSHD